MMAMRTRAPLGLQGVIIAVSAKEFPAPRAFAWGDNVDRTQDAVKVFGNFGRIEDDVTCAVGK